MHRRDFIKLSALGGSTLAIGGMITCAPEGSSGAGEKQPAAIPEFEFHEWTFAQFSEVMESGKHTARSITKAYLQRIEDVDRSGPSLNAVIEVNPQALEIADKLDEERASGRIRGPLHGIPIMIKDNIDTADQMLATAGSLALTDTRPADDAHIVERLRAAGAVLLGKTNLSEWANFRSEKSTSGWSGRGGQTHNPYALDRNPCGSSSGSGVAASANLCAAAIGTETNGSVVCPSHQNGIVGIKPTLGMLSRSGIIPIAHTQDTAGPMARTVRDGAILLSALAGPDPQDPITQDHQDRIHSDYTRFLDPEGLKGSRIGIARNLMGYHEGVDALMEEAVALMKDQGAELVDEADIVTKGDYGSASYDVLLYEFKADLNIYFASRGPTAGVKTLEQLIAFNEANADTELPYFGQEILIKSQAKGDLGSKEYKQALKKVKRLAGRDGIDATLAKHEVDLIIAPTGGPAWFTDWINGDHFLGASSSAAARAGYPNITVPMGFVHGLPVGLSFFSTAWSEPLLLKVAFAYEQASRHRQAPQFRDTVEYEAS